MLRENIFQRFVLSVITYNGNPLKHINFRTAPSSRHSSMTKIKSPRKEGASPKPSDKVDLEQSLDEAIAR